MIYTFRYTELTIGDYHAMLDLFLSKSQNILPLLAIISRCSAVDVYALPMSEFIPLVRQFSIGLNAYYQEIIAAQEEVELPEAMRLLRGLFRENE